MALQGDMWMRNENTPSLRCWCFFNCGRIPLIMNNLMVVVGFLKTHTVKTLPKKTLSARRPWRQSPHTKILLGCLAAGDQTQLNNGSKLSLPIAVFSRWIHVSWQRKKKPSKVPSKGFLRLQSSVKIHKASQKWKHKLDQSLFLQIPGMNSELKSQTSLQISELLAI